MLGCSYALPGPLQSLWCILRVRRRDCEKGEARGKALYKVGGGDKPLQSHLSFYLWANSLFSLPVARTVMYQYSSPKLVTLVYRYIPVHKPLLLFSSWCGQRVT